MCSQAAHFCVINPQHFVELGLKKPLKYDKENVVDESMLMEDYTLHGSDDKQMWVTVILARADTYFRF